MSIQIQLIHKGRSRDIAQIASAVAETAIQAQLLGADGYSGAVSSLFRGLEALRGTDTIESRAIALIEETACYAIASLIASSNRDGRIGQAEVAEFTRQAISGMRTSFEQNKLYITENEIANPLTLSVLDKVAKDAIFYFGQRGMKGSKENNLARFANFLSDGMSRIWHKRPEYFRPIADIFYSPTGPASDYVRAWANYRSILIAQFEDEPLFGEDAAGVGIAQVYLPIRCWWEEVTESSGQKLTHNIAEEKKPKAICIDDVEQTVATWLSRFDVKDRVRFISGGPGSGKSTFAKKLAASLSTQSRWRVLFVPLQRLRGTDHLENRIEDYLTHEYGTPFGRSTPALRGLGSDGHKDWLFIFDGLDELAKEGEGSESAAQDFASALADYLGRLGGIAQARFMVLGRAPSMQEARRRLNLGAEKTLHVLDMLPFDGRRQSYLLSDCAVRDKNDIAKKDQRLDFWARWAVAKRKPITPPVAMTTKELEDLTKEPLLAHLLIISGYVEERWQEAAENRNRIYESIFRRIWVRESGKESRRDLNDLGENAFILLLQSLGIAAWRGGGRTGDEAAFLKIRDVLLPPSILKKVGDRRSTNLANVALLFYTRKDEEGGQGYEFIHKSFGEYLTAGGILSAFLRWADQVADDNSDFEVEDLLNRWLSLTGATRLSSEVHAFLKNEVRLRLEQKDSNDHLVPVRRCVKVAAELVDRVLVHGFPVTNTTLSFRELEREQLNAEYSLWCMLDALGRVAYPMHLLHADEPHGWKAGPILLKNLNSSHFSLLKLTSRYHDFDSGPSIYRRYSYRPRLFLGHVGTESPVRRLISRLSLHDSFLGFSAFEGWDFEGVDFGGSDFTNSFLVGCDFRGANLTGVSFRAAEIEASSFDNSVLDRVDFRDSHIGSDVSFKARSVVDTKIPKSSSKGKGLLRRVFEDGISLSRSF